MTITEVGIGTEALVPVADFGTDDYGYSEFGAEAQASNGIWSEAAACRTVPDASNLFFSEEVPEIVAAKRICAECPVIAPCLEAAIERREPCGVWGGQLFENGQIIHRKRRRGRPPKVARPEDQLLQVPIPEHLQKLIA